MAEKDNPGNKELKDLTDLLKYSETLKQSGELPPAPEGSVMEQPPIETINDFESLESYAVANPAPEPAPDAADQLIAASIAASKKEHETRSNLSIGTDFPTTPQESQPEGHGLDLGTMPEGVPGISLEPPSTPTDEPAIDLSAPSDPAASPSSLEVDFTADPFPSLEPDLATPDLGAPDLAAPDFSDAPGLAAPDLALEEPAMGLDLDSAEPEPMAMVMTPEIATQSPLEPSPPPLPEPSAMEKVKQYSDKMPIGKPVVSAAYPFSILIHGTLLDHERERLLDILSRENVGIREMDLEPQLAGGRILLPRISEYAAVVIVQALRGANARIVTGPSDSIFSTTDTKEEAASNYGAGAESMSANSETTHIAEHLPLTTDGEVMGMSNLKLIDTVTASAGLKSQSVEAESSMEYQELVEALQRELKYKAFRKGADAIVHFKVDLTHLSSPTHYKILASGSAVKKGTTPPPPPRPKESSEVSLESVLDST